MQKWVAHSGEHHVRNKKLLLVGVRIVKRVTSHQRPKFVLGPLLRIRIIIWWENRRRWLRCYQSKTLLEFWLGGPDLASRATQLTSINQGWNDVYWLALVLLLVLEKRQKRMWPPRRRDAASVRRGEIKILLHSHAARKLQFHACMTWCADAMPKHLCGSVWPGSLPNLNNLRRSRWRLTRLSYAFSFTSQLHQAIKHISLTVAFENQ